MPYLTDKELKAAEMETQQALARKAFRVGNVILASAGALVVVLLGGVMYAGLRIVHALTSGCF